MKLIPMVTGLKTTQKNSNLTTNYKKELSIQVNLNGLSFCVFNRSENSIEHLSLFHFEKKENPSVLLQNIQKHLASNTAFSDSFDQVTLLYQNDLATLVPLELFNPANAADYLKFNSKILKLDVIEFDEIRSNKSVIIYVPLMNINNYIFETFGEFTFKHTAAVLIETLLNQENDANPKVYINMNFAHFEMLVLKNQGLEFYNYFEFSSPEDFIYYVLFTFEQLGLNPEDIPVYFTGEISDESECYKMAFTYIRHLHFLNPNYKFRFDSNIESTQAHRHFTILNSF
ncbi:DUF3822 family protein [Paucihalobacter ruber]|uniref:DUF3822 family protein n=1 Tax=Paucihalobacter ruber TaxID=2567861 RepID=A0A506PEQ0_9FLAO|nr:DUF3822 family protein [Paucihalobacter ruber]TPV31547.1 DUF3822 family protein [Paucihalobacter ruber]